MTQTLKEENARIAPPRAQVQDFFAEVERRLATIVPAERAEPSSRATGPEPIASKPKAARVKPPEYSTAITLAAHLMHLTLVFAILPIGIYVAIITAFRGENFRRTAQVMTVGGLTLVALMMVFHLS